ncbi:MAG: DUF2953 domain-containing protein [Ruminococcaceae bacterium]|nr:DUF2953 domain-containing protein [Oscillospiraceae bacterium]
MKIIGLIILVLLILIAIVFGICLFAKIRLVIKFSKSRDDNGSFDARMELFGGRVVKSLKTSYNDESDRVKEKSHTSDDDLKFSERVKKYYNIFLKVRYTWLKSKLRVRKNVFAEKIMLKINFGFEDAFATGITTGALWAGAYNVIAFLAGIIRIAEPDVVITPVFDDELIEAEAECILRFRLVNIMIILATVGFNYYIINRKLSKNEKAAINYGNTN